MLPTIQPSMLPATSLVTARHWQPSVLWSDSRNYFQWTFSMNIFSEHFVYPTAFAKFAHRGNLIRGLLKIYSRRMGLFSALKHCATGKYSWKVRPALHLRWFNGTKDALKPVATDRTTDYSCAYFRVDIQSTRECLLKSVYKRASTRERPLENFHQKSTRHTPYASLKSSGFVCSREIPSSDRQGAPGD